MTSLLERAEQARVIKIEQEQRCARQRRCAYMLVEVRSLQIAISSILGIPVDPASFRIIHHGRREAEYPAWQDAETTLLFAMYESTFSVRLGCGVRHSVHFAGISTLAQLGDVVKEALERCPTGDCVYGYRRSY